MLLLLLLRLIRGGSQSHSVNESVVSVRRLTCMHGMSGLQDQRRTSSIFFFSFSRALPHLALLFVVGSPIRDGGCLYYYDDVDYHYYSTTWPAYR
jgi:hypothetical protein